MRYLFWCGVPRLDTERKCGLDRLIFRTARSSEHKASGTVIPAGVVTLMRGMLRAVSVSTGRRGEQRGDRMTGQTQASRSSRSETIVGWAASQRSRGVCVPEAGVTKSRTERASSESSLSVAQVRSGSTALRSGALGPSCRPSTKLVLVGRRRRLCPWCRKTSTSCAEELMVSLWRFCLGVHARSRMVPFCLRDEDRGDRRRD